MRQRGFFRGGYKDPFLLKIEPPTFQSIRRQQCHHRPANPCKRLYIFGHCKAMKLWNKDSWIKVLPLVEMASDQMCRRHVREAQKKCFQMPNFWLKVFVESKMLLWEKVQLSSNGQNFKSNHSENTKKLKSEKKSSEILFLIFFSRWRPRTFSSLRWPKQL